MPLAVVRSIREIRARLAVARPEGDLVGLVPTMGALHAGHLSLLKLARAESAVTAVSIFVNPLQFDREADLATYPRSLDRDLEMCASAGVDLVFAPSSGEIYPVPLDCTIHVGRVADHLCGRARPGHFNGVATVVTKLFQIVQPNRAYFGEKDAQQLAVIRRLVSDLNVPVDIISVPTVREADGLALSSRNQRLSANGRQAAPVLYQALVECRRRIAAGEKDASRIRDAGATIIGTRPEVTLEYLEVVEPEEMHPVPRIDDSVIVAGAVWIDAVRLIDNVFCVPPA